MLYYNPPIPFLTPIILYSTLFIVILQQNSNYNIITGMNIENAICSSVISVVKGLYGQDVPEKMVQLQKTRSNFEGNLTLVVFPFLKISKKNPEQTAQEIGEALVKECSAVAAFNVVKGFLNLTVAKEAWI